VRNVELTGRGAFGADRLDELAVLVDQFNASGLYPAFDMMFGFASTSALL
jgi:hypothetical protein